MIDLLSRYSDIVLCCRFSLHVAEPAAHWLGSASPHGLSFDSSLVPWSCRAPSLRPKPSESRRSLRPAFKSFSSPQTFFYVVKRREAFKGLCLLLRVQTETLVWHEGNHHSHQSTWSLIQSSWSGVYSRYHTCSYLCRDEGNTCLSLYVRKLWINDSCHYWFTHLFNFTSNKQIINFFLTVFHWSQGGKLSNVALLE